MNKLRRLAANHEKIEILRNSCVIGNESFEIRVSKCGLEIISKALGSSGCLYIGLEEVESLNKLLDELLGE